MTTFKKALESFEATEANLKRLETLCDEIYALIPSGISFGSNSDYDDKVRVAYDLFESLPAIDGWQPDIQFSDLDMIAQNRFDILELGDPMAGISMEQSLESPRRAVDEYRFRLTKKRRQLIRGTITELIERVDAVLSAVEPELETKEESEKASPDHLEALRDSFSQIDTLLGSLDRPPRWSDMSRHLHFGLMCDMRDIAGFDWPSIKEGMNGVLYGVDDPIPVAVSDLGTLVAEKPAGPIPTELDWAKIDEGIFERLIYSLISTTEGYENPDWLTKTRASDRGRDLSAYRVIKDELVGTLRHRVIIQCKHWTGSIAVGEVAKLKEQMKLWEPPRVDVLVIATSGNFTTDAVDLIEKQNRSDSALRMEMWPSSHLERLLASRPDLIAEFGLR